MLLSKGQAPVVDFNFSNNCLLDSSVFIDASFSPQGNIIQYTWNFGDGNSTNGSQASNLYAQAGKYKVSLEAISDSGCVGSKEDSIQVYQLPQSSFTTSILCEGQNATFTSNSTRGDARILFENWNVKALNSGNTINQNGDSITLSLSDSAFSISLQSTDTLGCQSSFSDTIFPLKLPQPAIAFSEPCLMDSVMIFDLDTSTLHSKQWIISNGVFTNDDTVKTLFPVAAKYQIQLISISQAGCSDTVTREIDIQSALAITTPANDTICSGTNFIWNPNLSNTFNYLWSDGSTASTLSIADSGKYSLAVVTDTFGCRTLSDTVFIDVNGFPSNFSLGADTSFCEGGFLSVVSDTNEISSILWPDSTSTYSFIPVQNGNVIAMATDSFGCQIFRKRHFKLCFPR